MKQTKKNMQKQKVTIRLELTGPLKEKFECLMQNYGTATGTSLVRYLIDIKYDELAKRKRSQ